MAKSKEVKRKEAEVRALESDYKAPKQPCKRCKWHRNKPSRCVMPGYPVAFIGRTDSCLEWRSK